MRPVILCILDGVGVGLGGDDDAIATARTPHLDALREGPWRTLKAHGTAVGLPSDGDMGNSEVGHNAMGAGRVFAQGAKLVEGALQSGAIFETELWAKVVSKPTVHFLGLLSDGNVHSHCAHLEQLIERAAADGVKRVRVHVLTDGRDVEAKSALRFVEPLEAQLARHRDEGRDYRVASGGGRMHITMDRYEADWEMVRRGWNCHVHGEGRGFSSASEAISTLYAEDAEVDDQYLPSFVVTDDGEPVGRIVSGDAVVFFNFRGDRAIEISRAFEEESFSEFDRGDRPDVLYAGMMQYDGDLAVPKQFLVDPPAIDRCMGEFLVAAGKRSFVCSETQKFGHVTFFFNGNRSGQLSDELETYLQIPSDTLPFQERPWMKAAEITDAVIDALATGSYDHIRLNIANGDMVGHTGDLEATRIAVQAVDLCVGRLVRAAHEHNAVLLVTADHGNADEMLQHKKNGDLKLDDQGAPLLRTSHTLHPVPFAVVDPEGSIELAELDDAGLASIAATVLTLCGVEPPDDYEPSLI